MRPSERLLPSLVFLVGASGSSQGFIMPSNTGVTTSLSLDRAGATGNARKRRSGAVVPLSYTDDANAVDVDFKRQQLQQRQHGASVALSVPSGGASEALRYAFKAVPLLSAAAFLGVLATRWLGGFSSPAAQGAKLVYAGAIAGMLSRTCCAPIEMVSTVMMCRGDACSSMTDELAKTWRKEGVRGMFKGNGANCLKVAPSRGTQFLVYEFVKRRMLLAGIGLASTMSDPSLHAGARLFAGGVAGMVAASIVYPLEVVKTMLTLYPDQCRSIPDALSRVYRTSGVRGLYRGLGPTLVAMFPYVGVEFMVYETLKGRWEAHVGPVGTVALLLMGAAGGAAAQTSAHPLDVIRRRMQMQGIDAETKKKKEGDGEVGGQEERYSNMFTGLYRVAKTEGVHVLFNGLGPACFEKIPSTAIGYFIYEFLKVTLKVTSV
mmetsp:Transcript_3331/g.8488  ORF Transcript_3331/g.8488 Transcript_3331/m.8488 type:complete len:433 (+) Transcript_3331:158-1456(+)